MNRDRAQPQPGSSGSRARLVPALVFLLALLAGAAAYLRLPFPEAGEFDTTPPTPFFRYEPVGNMRGRALVVHGFDSSKNTMSLVAHGFAEAGYEVFSIDMPGHGDSSAPFDALVARAVIADILSRLGEDTVAVGHSLGAALLVDVALERPVNRMVLFSPAPTLVEPVLSGQVLMIEGQFDPGHIRAFVGRMAQEKPAVEVYDLPWTGHSGALFRPPVIESAVKWLGAPIENLRLWQRLGLWLVMMVSSLGLGLALLGSAPTSGSVAPPLRNIVVAYVIAAAAGAGFLAAVNLGSWLRLFATDYLIALLLLTGSALLLQPWLQREALRLDLRNLALAAAAAAYVIVVPALLIASELVHLTLSGGRWWRFAAIAVLGLPLCVSDEVFIRPVRPWLKAVAAAVLTRMLVGAIAATGVLLLSQADRFLLMLIPLILIFWTGLWLAGAAVWRQTRDPVAAAVFMAVVQAWVFAALFVVI
jgi:pimeloyl-ACP methyl ester carboxylesterase